MSGDRPPSGPRSSAISDHISRLLLLATAGVYRSDRLDPIGDTVLVDHSAALIETIAIGLAAAFIGGTIATRLRLPTIVGYLLAVRGTAIRVSRREPRRDPARDAARGRRESVVAFVIAALTVGAALSQVGEFSFFLATLGLTLALIPEDAFQLVVAAALISITLNQVLFGLIGPAEAAVRARPSLLRLLYGGAPPEPGREAA